jgi:Ca2+/H+ antiporter, TMEM165/GDT1 family
LPTPLAAAGAARIATTILAAFLASLVECVEALTVVLAVGSVRGWPSALAGCAAALATLAAIVAALGPALTRVPLHLIQLIVGSMVLLFGMRWLRKAILRASGLIPLHDEAAAFAKNTAAMHAASPANTAARPASAFLNPDKIAFAAAFHITMLEGTEVVFLVIALGAGGLLAPAAAGAGLAALTIAALGLALHRPLARVPENTLKFTVGVLLSAFGTFWVGEGAAVRWPLGDLAILYLIAFWLILAAEMVAVTRHRAAHQTVAD